MRSCHFLSVGHYSAHLSRQEADLRLFMEDESLKLDPDMDYFAVEGLSSEVRERLGKVRPGTIASISLCQLKERTNKREGCRKTYGGYDTHVHCLPFKACEENLREIAESTSYPCRGR